MILRATSSQIGSFRSTKPRRLRASANARFSLSTSSGLNLPSFNRRLIGIPAPAHCDATTRCRSWVAITWVTAHLAPHGLSGWFSQSQPVSSQSRHSIGRSWHFRRLEPTGCSAVSSPCRAIPNPLGPACPRAARPVSNRVGPSRTRPNSNKEAPCSGTVSSKPRPFNNVFRTRRSACSELERGQSHCFSDRGQSGKPGGAPLDAPSLGKDHPGPHPAPRAGLFALHLDQRLKFSCGTDGGCTLGSELLNHAD
jgi:hypothetical protein